MQLGLAVVKQWGILKEKNLDTGEHWPYTGTVVGKTAHRPLRRERHCLYYSGKPSKSAPGREMSLSFLSGT